MRTHGVEVKYSTRVERLYHEWMSKGKEGTWNRIDLESLDMKNEVASKVGNEDQV
jgi:hypothetical protein